MERCVKSGGIGLLFILMFAVNTQASLVMTATTDKPIYQLDEPVAITVTLYNSGTSPIEVDFPWSNCLSYVMDDTYSPLYGQISLPFLITLTLNPGDSREWNFVHTAEAMQAYPLQTGTHSVIGQIGFSGPKSSPTSFEVVPEPIVMPMLLIGFAGLIKKKAGYNGK